MSCKPITWIALGLLAVQLSTAPSAYANRPAEANLPAEAPASAASRSDALARLSASSALREARADKKPAALGFHREASEYLAAQDPSDRFVQAARSIVKDEPALDPRRRLIVAIPAAGHAEGEGIYRTLTTFAEQTLDPEHFEVVVFVNTRAGRADRTSEHVERFQRAHPSVHVRLWRHTWAAGEALTMGAIRKVATDAIVRLAHQASLADPVVLSSDADLRTSDPRRLATFLERYEHARPLAVNGQLEFDGMTTNDSFRANARMMQYSNALLRRMHRRGVEGLPAPRMSLSGANSVVSLAAYCAIGGYDPTVDRGEDGELGARLRLVPHPYPILDGRKPTRIVVDGRRQFIAHNRGIALRDSWRSWKPGSLGDADREGALARLEPFEARRDPARFQRQMQHLLNQYFAPPGRDRRGADDPRAMLHLGGRVAELMGMKVSIDEDARRLRLESVKHTVQRLERARAAAPPRR